MIRTAPIGRGRSRDAGGRFTGLDYLGSQVKLQIKIDLDTQLARQLQQVGEALQKNAVYSLKGAAYTMSQYAKASIVATRRMGSTKGGRGGVASSPGKPPHTRGIPGKNLRNAIWYEWANERKESIFIGPRGSHIGDVAAVHEFGGRREGKMRSATYPARPFMGPALIRTLPQIPSKFRSSLVGP